MPRRLHDAERGEARLDSCACKAYSCMFLGQYKERELTQLIGSSILTRGTVLHQRGRSTGRTREDNGRESGRATDNCIRY